MRLYSLLIVDDDKDMREVLTSILEDEGYSIEAVGNGKEAIKICKKYHFDVAIIDIELPDVQGTELLAKLKAIQPKMVNIIITGHPSIENAMEAVNEKADAYFLKPFDVKKLLETINKLLTAKSNEYLRMFEEVKQAKANTPIFRYQTPDKW